MDVVLNETHGRCCTDLPGLFDGVGPLVMFYGNGGCYFPVTTLCLARPTEKDGP